MKTKILLKEETIPLKQEQCLDVGLGLQHTGVTTPNQSVQVRKSYKFRLYPNKEQITALDTNIELCRVLYNTALQEQVEAWDWYKKNIANAKAVEKPICNRATQSAQLPAIKEGCPEYKGVFSQVLQDVLGRLDCAFANFFAPVKKGAAKGGLNKSILDAGWGYFNQMVAYKAAYAGKLYDKVDPRGTSQVCSECDKLVPKEWSERVHKCPYCGTQLDRDHNSAREIEHRGLVKHNLLPILSWNKGAVCALRE